MGSNDADCIRIDEALFIVVTVWRVPGNRMAFALKAAV
jgi:hypothetical protein